MKILISGAGVAGPCLAYWLRRHGFEPTIVERAARPRTGGYVIDFWGAGFEVAVRMGLAPRILERGYRVRELREVGRDGKRLSGFPVSVFDRLTKGQYTTVARSELAATLYAALEDQVETLFDDTVVALEDRGHDLRVSFERGSPRTFDLVVGADGLHSPVRRLVFGEDPRFERYLGMKVAAFAATGYQPRDELTYVVHSEVGQQMGRFAMRDDRTMFLFVFADPSAEIPTELETQKALLRDRYSRSGWESAEILRRLDAADTLYLDRVSQIRLDAWTRGRVALVGDAAFCPSLLAGQGTALAMVAAYVLAGELKRAAGDHEAAFSKYHERLSAFISGKQEGAIGLASFFAPKSRAAMFIRNQVMRVMSLRFVAELAIGREIQDRVDLPDY